MIPVQMIAILFFIYLFNAFSLIPFLIFKSLRKLLGKVTPYSIILNYTAVVFLFSLVQLTILMIVVVVNSGIGGVNVFWILGVLWVGTELFMSLILGVFLPYLGLWKPDQNGGIDGRYALIILSIWYVICTAICLFSLLVMLIIFFFPG